MECDKWKRDVLPSLLKDYQEQDIFNADETGLFFKCLPDKTLTFKNEKCHGGKHSKERVTLLLAANMDGSEKLRILLIGKSNKPRCFRGVKWLPLDYKANSKAWMTGQLFEEWLLTLDKQFGNKGRKILLFLDNCPAHPQNIQRKLHFIKLAFFPPNMTSKLQPLDQGVIQNLKCYYRRRVLKKTIEHMEENKKFSITLKDCVDDVTKSWDIDVKPETIANCFKNAGFGQCTVWEEEDDIPLVFLKEQLNHINKENTTVIQTEYESWVHLNISQGTGTLDDYMQVDDDLVTSEFPTDVDIVKSYLDMDDSESDDEQEDFQPPSNDMVANSIRILNLYLQTNEDTTECIYRDLNRIEAFFENKIKKTVHQSQITDYFTQE